MDVRPLDSVRGAFRSPYGLGLRQTIVGAHSRRLTTLPLDAERRAGTRRADDGRDREGLVMLVMAVAHVLVRVAVVAVDHLPQRVDRESAHRNAADAGDVRQGLVAN